MDFHGLIYEAHRNEVTKDKTKPRLYPSSFAPPKKEEKTKGLSVNVKKFLARKEEEEKQRRIEEEKKKEKLLELRNQDNKAKKRVQVMLKRTKSYNKSVLEDAIDKVNTADTMNGPQQCDEDDYGYVSKEASAFYSKMMDKYVATPTEEDKFSKKKKTLSSDLVGTKDRVKMALQRQEEEEMMPHKRKRKKKDDDDGNHNEPDDEPTHSSDKYHSKDKETDKYHSREKEKEHKPKPKRPPPPPPLDFSELLKMAEKKQHEPPPLELKIKEAKRQQQQQQQQQREPERLMTKKEKLEYERTRDKRLQRESGASNDAKRESNNKPDSSRGKQDERGKVKEQKSREDERIRRDREQEKRRQEEREQERRRQEDREQERRRQEDREQERRGQEYRERERRRQEEDRRRQEDRERERRRLEDRERERRRLEDREQERRRDEDRERQRERERIRELEEELARHKERERLREEEERREREKKYQPVPKKTDGKPISKPSSSFSSKPKEKVEKPNSDRSSFSKDYRNGEVKKKLVAGSDKMSSLFGGRDSVSPEKKVEKPKPRPVERIKINNTTSASVDDLFGDDVTIRTKQKPVPNSSSNKNLPLKSNDKPSMGTKPSLSESKLGRDNPKRDGLNPEKKRPSDMDGRGYPEKRPRPGDVRPADRGPPSGKQLVRKEFPPKDLKSRQFPPKDLKSRQFPPADVRSRQFPPSDVSRKDPASNRRLQYERADSDDSSEEDEEDEYDSELDDFIDDGPLEDEPNVSSVIREIFGYDKSRYANIDDDDECMESNYAQVMQEEKKSLLIGLKEDERERLEEEKHKRLKALRKMQEAKARKRF